MLSPEQFKDEASFLNALRDWFAGQALARMVIDHCDSCDGYRAAVSRRAYLVAEAMLKARAIAASESTP